MADFFSPLCPWCLNWLASQLWLLVLVLVLVLAPTLTLFCACGSGSYVDHLVDWQHSYKKHFYAHSWYTGPGHHNELAMSDYIGWYVTMRDTRDSHLLAVIYVPGQTSHLNWRPAKLPANWTGFKGL